MGSTRAEGRTVGAVPRAEADLVEAAAALRWARPDLTAELADHVLEGASAVDRQDRWLAAAGWAVHARAATGDGRDTACRILTALSRWDSDALAGSSASRLRVELAMVAAGAGEVDFARRLLAGVPDDGDPELAADLLCAHARCAVEDAPGEVVGALDAADAAWATVGGPAAELGGASVALMRAVVERRAGRPAAAVDHAVNGLGRLERGRTGSGSPSGHLAAALAAEWISALLDAGRATEAQDGCSALLPRLSEQARPTRQLALLRLTVARALAAQDPSADTVQLLEQAADDAAGSDVPDLEAVCRTALGALHEQASRLEVALEELQLAVGAERSDRDRSRRFTAALAELPAEPERTSRRGERAVTTTTAGDGESTTSLPAITRRDRKISTTKREEHERAGRGSNGRRRDDVGAGRRRGETPEKERATSRFERMLEEDPPAAAEAADDERPAAWDAVPWNGSAGDSPIGDLLMRSLRAGSTENIDGGAGRRNGRVPGGSALPSDGDSVPRSRNGRVPGTESTESPADSASGRAGRRRAAESSDAPSGWLPSLDSDRAGERRTQGRRRGRSADTDRSRTTPSASSREDHDEVTSTPPRSTHPESIGFPDDDRLLGTDGVGSSERAGRRASDRRQGSRRRSRHDDTGGADGIGRRAAHGRHGSAADGDDLDGTATAERFALAPDEPTAKRDLADEVGELSWDTPSDGGPRRPADDPWATGRWSVRSDPHGEEDPVPTATEDIETSAGTSPSAGDDSGGWLQSALAELDRALSGIGLGESARLQDEPQDDGCTVVVDIARDGRRFAGPRAASVVRSVADLLADRLPAGARSRFGDSDALVITAPGWRRSDATDWMHRTLPALLDGFVATEALPGAQLRVAVHDADGPVGAQILQHLTTQPSREREVSEERRRGDDRDLDPWADYTARDSEARGREYRAAARAGRQERGAGSRSRREDDSEPAEQPVGDDGSPRWPWSGEDGPADLEAPADERDGPGPESPDPVRELGGRRSRDRETGATLRWTNETESAGRDDAVPGRSTVSTRGAAGGRGSRHRASAQERTSDGQGRGDSATSGRATGRRNGEATGTAAVGAEAPDTGMAGRRPGNDRRETERSGADRNGSAPDAGERDGRGPGAAAVDTAPDRAEATSGGEPGRPESTEGLGIADLLAGALAAYRGI